MTATITTTEARERALALGVEVPTTIDLISTPEDASLAEMQRSLVPSFDLAPTVDGSAGYVMRDLDGFLDLTTFARALDNRFNVLLSGPTGAAKSLSARAFAALHRLPFYAVAINGGVDPSSLWGRWLLIEGDLVWQWSPAALVVMHGGVLLIDEINMAHPRILAALHDLLSGSRQVSITEKHGEMLKAHPATLFVATLNPDYQGVARLNQAMRRRFSWGFRWDYSPEVEESLISSPSLLRVARNVRSRSEVVTDLSTDALVTFVETAHAMGLRFATGRLLDGFRESERGGVARALEAESVNIANELGIEAQGVAL